MRQIASEAQVNKFMLYYHFSSKEALFQRVLDDTFQPVFRQLAKILARDNSLDKAISDIYDMFAILFAANEGRLRPFMAREIAVGAPRLGSMFAQMMPRAMELWRPKILTYMGAGQISDRQLLFAVHSIMTGIVSRFLLEPAFTQIQDAASLSPHSPDVKVHVVDFILGGLRLSLFTAA